MDRDVTDKICERAYELWVAGGTQEGQSELNWITAEQEVLAAAAVVAAKGRARLQTAKTGTEARAKRESAPRN